jgi:hypothetical protein
MKRLVLVCLGLILVGSYAGCLPEDPGSPTGAAGSSGPGAAGSGTPGSAGNPGTAGTDATGGTTGGGGNSTPGDAGSSGPGIAGSGGGTAGSTAGSGPGGSTAGSGPGGSTAGAGGGLAGRGGSTGGSTAGAGGGLAGRGGSTAGTGGGLAGRGGSTAGTGGSTAGTGGTLPTIPELFPTSGSIGSLDGRLVVMPCGDANTGGTDCGGGGAYYSTAGSTTATRIACSGSALNVNQVFYVGGETGRMYNVTVHFYGVAEPKVYGNGITREAGTGRPANTTTTTGAGATPTAWATAAGGHAVPASDYNTNEIRVCRTRACATADETNVYYLNADTSQGHWSYVLNYEKDIVVVGGGAVRVRNYDQNCRQIKNCGPNGTAPGDCATMANRRIIDLSAASPRPSNMPAAMGGLLQPQLVSERDPGSAGQWLLIDVVKINSVQ